MMIRQWPSEVSHNCTHQRATTLPSGVNPDRYHRQMLLRDIGEEGQHRLAQSHALLVGCGALGCACADLLARAGVGRLTIIERDVVELSNLQRQTLFDERHATAALPKAEAAKQRLAEINSNIHVDAIIANFSHENAERLTGFDSPPPSGSGGTGVSPVPHSSSPLGSGGAGVPPVPHSSSPLGSGGAGVPPASLGSGGTGVPPASLGSGGTGVPPVPHSSSPPLSPGGTGVSPEPDVLIDATDNFETRLLLNDLAVKHSRALCYAGVLGTRATQATFRPGGRPCLRCLMPTAPAPGTMATCDTAGVFSPAVAIVAACQASDAIKVLLGRDDLVSRSLLSLDLWTNERRRIDLSSLAGDSCPCCANRRFDYLAGEGTAIIERLCGQNATQVRPGGAAKLDMPAIADRLKRVGQVTANKFLIRCTLPHERGDNGEAVEMTLFADGRALVKGLAEPAAAKSLYARYIGV